jgi:diguanylate cyclase (GGDEF)-like protein/PAS domain S-box-containing protein
MPPKERMHTPLPWPSSSDSSALLRHLMENVAIGIALVGPDRRIAYANPAFSDMLGYEPGECAALAVDDIVPHEAPDDVRDQLRRLAAGEIEIYRAERLCLRKDGGAFWGRMSVSRLRDDRTGSPIHLVVQLEDIGREKRAEAALVKNELRMNYALESAGQGVWDYDLNTKQMFYSRMWRLMRGFGPDEEIDSALDVWLTRVHPDDRERIHEIVRRQDSGELDYNAFEYRERRRDGRWIWILSRGKPVEWNPDRSPARIIGTDTDITELKEEEARRAKEMEETFRENLAKLQQAHQAAEAAQQLAFSLARHDALTGLPNRRVFSEVLEKAIAKANRGTSVHAVLIIDLDRFKPVNDIHGHAAGDAVLCEVANRLKDVVRGSDTVARLGGDEFAVVLDCASDTKAPGEAAIQLAERVIQAVKGPITYDNRTIEVGASIGIAICPTDGRDADTMLHAADMAMYRAKQESRGTFRFFQRSMEAELRAQASLEEDVRRAVAGREIEPHYQPLIKLSENRLIGFEILARWHHPTRGDVPPDVFIPVVERLGLIADLTYTLLRRACQEAKNWSPEITIALNVSPFHLGDPLLPVKFLAILSETGFPPTRLEIEVTEHAVTHNLDAAQRTVKTLQDLGIKISLDDFGTGYSNLSHLRQFRFDKIKIDRSFVQSMETDAGNAKLVQSILDLARNLGLPTIAEGIEHLATLRQIVAAGGEFGQGFYFAKAMPAAEVETMLRRIAAETGESEQRLGAA